MCLRPSFGSSASADMKLGLNLDYLVIMLPTLGPTRPTLYFPSLFVCGISMHPSHLVLTLLFVHGLAFIR